MSPTLEVLRIRASNRRRCTSKVRPAKQAIPAIPPTVIASKVRSALARQER